MSNNIETKLRINVEEQVVQSKTGHAEDCEDFIYVSDNFMAVIDGATSKTNAKWDGDTPGKTAGKLIIKSLENIPQNSTAREAIDIMTAKIHEFYSKKQLLDQLKVEPSLKASASLVVLSLVRKEIWFVGDCQALVGKKTIRVEKKIDRLLSEIRALYLESEILRGKTVEQLLTKDTGREYIVPLLERQQFLQNNPSQSYWYSAVDGFPVPDEGIIVEPISSKTSSVVLASDGYANLGGTLDKSEQALQQLLVDDPLLFRKFKSTKGMLVNQISYDDRAYLRVSINKE